MIGLPFRLLSAGLLFAVAAGPRRPAPALAVIEANRNRQPAGRLANGVLTLALEARWGEWHPNGPDGGRLRILAFGEAGKRLQNPGPLVRVPAGTVIQASIRNATDSVLVVHGLYTRPAASADSIVIPPHGERRTRFSLAVAGTYYYWGSTTRLTIGDRDGEDSQLSGAIVVDSAGAPTAPDRIFVLGVWTRPASYPTAGIDSLQEVMVINGEAWPNTERLAFTQGDTVRWRWINPSSSSHPMHLHGFYFEVESRGDEARDTSYDSGHRFLAVTELMLPGGTAALQWSPDRAGQWLFHCHFSFHISPDVSLQGPAAIHAGMAAMAGMAPRRPGAVNWHHTMGGLILGLNVRPGPHDTPRPPTADARQIRLLVQSRPKRFGTAPGYGYVIQSGGKEPAADSIVIPGAPLILTRGQPVRITIVNHLSDLTSVHWHGIELESAPDGVPGWSGIPPSVTPPIQPGDSFVASFTPPRAGTFIYHNHMNELEQMHLGLYGPLIVLAPGASWNPDTDHVVLVSPDGESTDSTRGLINGSADPPPLRLRAGVVHRLRLINIHGDDRIVFALRQQDSLARWRPVAKDGADLPAALSVWRPAELMTGPGETEDFQFQAEQPGEFALVVSAPFAAIPWQMALRIVVE